MLSMSLRSELSQEVGFVGLDPLSWKTALQDTILSVVPS